MWNLTVLLAALASGGPDLTDSPTQAYARVLERHVADGTVDYAGLSKKSLGDLERFVEAVAKAPLPEGRDARIAWLVDAYNALVLRSVIRHGQPRSVLDVEGFFKKERHRVAGRNLTLDQLEKEVLNPLARDPRTHFVLVCAAKGCPILESVPYAGSNIERRLEGAARRYVRSSSGARVSAGKLAVSKIFEWYAADFGGEAGVNGFVTARLAPKDRRVLGDRPKLSYFDYDWGLNAP